VDYVWDRNDPRDEVGMWWLGPAFVHNVLAVGLEATVILFRCGDHVNLDWNCGLLLQAHKKRLEEDMNTTGNASLSFQHTGVIAGTGCPDRPNSSCIVVNLPCEVKALAFIVPARRRVDTIAGYLCIDCNVEPAIGATSTT
jgi:hypothetical protein